jgi:hypothetical protein
LLGFNKGNNNSKTKICSLTKCSVCCPLGVS